MSGFLRLSSFRKTKARPLFFMIGLLCAGCASNRHLDSLRAPFTSLTVPQGDALSGDNLDIAQSLSLGGMPARAPHWTLGPTEYVVRPGYVLEYSSDLKIPVWVCEHLKAEDLNGDVDRRNNFQPDPKLSGPRSELSDYKGSGFDRGHQAPAGDQTKSQDRNDETFYLSNMAPQEGPFNQQVWEKVEELARHYAEEFGDIYVITGGFFYDPAEDDPSTADGWVNYTEIGKGVAVPTHFYKILARKDTNGDVHLLSFVLENRKYPKPYDFGSFLRSVDWIEDRTELDFFPDFDLDAAEAAVGNLWD